MKQFIHQDQETYLQIELVEPLMALRLLRVGILIKVIFISSHSIEPLQQKCLYIIPAKF